MNAPESFVLLSEGHLLLPADQVTDLLRGLASGWLESAETGQPGGLHEETVLALAGVLMEIADQVDAECIALLPLTEEHEVPTEDTRADRGGGPDDPDDPDVPPSL